MATIQEAVRRLTVESVSKGVKETTADLNKLGQAHSGVTVESQKTERATQSMERRLNSIQRQYDRNYRVTQQMARVERDLNAAQAQGLITAARKNELMALASASHNAAAASAGRHTAALTALNARMATTAAMLPRMIGARVGMGGGLGGALLGGAFISNSAEQEKAMAQLEAVIRSTGGGAGYAAGELAKMAGEMQRVTTYSDEAVMTAQGLLLTFTRVGREVFPDALEAILNVSTAMDQGLKESTVQIGKALNDPIKGLTALQRVGIQFTASQREQIKVLQESGRFMEAQRVILKELEVQFGGSARAARDTLGGALAGLYNAFGDLFEVETDNTSRFREEINRLADLLGDPETKTALQTFGGWVFSFITSIIQGASIAIRKFAYEIDLIKNLKFQELLFPNAEQRDNFRFAITGEGGSFAEFGSLDRNIARSGEKKPGGRKPPADEISEEQRRAAEREAEFLRRANEQRETKLRMLEVERNSIFLTEEAAMKLALQEQELARLRERGIAETPQLVAEIEAWAEQYARVAAENKAIGEWVNLMSGAIKGFVTDFRDGIKNGEDAWESFKNAGINALDRISNKLLDMALDNMIQSVLGSLGGLGGGQRNPWMAGGARGGLLGGMIIPGILHGGGMVGSAPSSGRYVHPAYFDDAPRYHSGGVIGARERMIIAKDDEEMLTRDDPRHVKNGGKSGGGESVTIVNHNDFRGVDPSMRAWITQQQQVLKRDILAQVPSTVGRHKSHNPSYLRGGG